MAEDSASPVATGLEPQETEVTNTVDPAHAPTGPAATSPTEILPSLDGAAQIEPGGPRSSTPPPRYLSLTLDPDATAGTHAGGRFNGWRFIGGASLWSETSMEVIKQLAARLNLNPPDAEPVLSPGITQRRQVWAEAVVARSNAQPTQSAAEPHHCDFCGLALHNGPGPTWLYNREHRRTEYFGNAAPPVYDVVSYTWGRATADGWEHIPGVPWTVRRSHALPAQQVLEMVNMMAATHVWVDILCIPQQCPTAKSLEIARQADIFRGAVGGIAWMHQTGDILPLLSPVIAWADAVDVRIAQPSKNPDRPELDLASDQSRLLTFPAPPAGFFSGLTQLFSDPYFSSTWALQESILCPEMLMLGWEEATRFQSPPGTELRLPNLLDLRLALRNIRSAARHVIALYLADLLADRGTDHSIKMSILDALRVEDTLQAAGLDGFIEPKPASILASLGVRTSVKDQDRVYGVQAVYGMGLQGDYRRSLAELRGVFLSFVWQDFGPILALGLNPQRGRDRFSADINFQAVDNLHMFTKVQLTRSGIQAVPSGFSAIHASPVAQGRIALRSSLSSDDDKFHYEAISPGDNREVMLLHFAQYPIMHRLRAYSSDQSPEDPAAFGSWEPHSQQYTRLLYLGKFVHEFYTAELGVESHSYMEFYPKEDGTVQRVGAVISRVPLGHQRVTGEVVLEFQTDP